MEIEFCIIIVIIILYRVYQIIVIELIMIFCLSHTHIDVMDICYVTKLMRHFGTTVCMCSKITFATPEGLIELREPVC